MSEPMGEEARQRFESSIEALRPELHRYCSRMTGSVIDGEDIVQETLMRALFAIDQREGPVELRPWLFRIAHNAAIDFLRRADHKRLMLVEEIPEQGGEAELDIDATTFEAALSVFVSLPPMQRSALALRDVLGCSLSEIAQMTGATIPSIKAALVRARRRLPVEAAPAEISAGDLLRLRHYAELFNARHWEGLRALLQHDARLDLVSRAQRRGAAVREYYSRYADVSAAEALSMTPGLVDGALCLGVSRGSSLSYFILIEWRDDLIALIRDFRYVPYIKEDASFLPLSC